MLRFFLYVCAVITSLELLFIAPFVAVYALFTCGDGTLKHQQLVCDQIMRHPGDRQCRWIGPASDDFADVFLQTMNHVNDVIFNDIISTRFTMFLIVVAVLGIAASVIFVKTPDENKMGYDENGDPYPAQLRENIKNWKLDNTLMTVNWKYTSNLQSNFQKQQSNFGRDAGIVGFGLGILLARALRK